MKPRRFKTSLKNLLNVAIIASLVLGSLAFLTLGFAIVSYALNLGKAVTSLAFVLVGLVVIFLIVDITILITVQKKVYHDNLLQTIRDNLVALSNKKKAVLVHDQETVISDFKELNLLLDETIRICDQTIVYNKITNYNEIGIEFINDSKYVCSYESLTSKIPDLILGNEMFRCAFVDLFYEVGKNAKLDEETETRLTKTIIHELKYENILIAKHAGANPGFLVYVPHFESISQLGEEVDLLLRNLSIIQPTETGTEVVMCKAAVVAYPFSEITDILADLKYAAKQNKILSIFLPPYQAKQNDNLLQSTMNLANVTRFLQKFASLTFDEKDLSSNSKKVNKVLSQVTDYYGFETSGLIYYNDAQEKFEVAYEYSLPGLSLFNKGELVDANLVNVIDRVKDDDMSYYFSNRKHVNSLLAGYLDYYMISSGQFYVIRDANRIYGLVYFLNRNKEVNLDAYLREGLLTFSYFISSYAREILTRMGAKNSDIRFNDIARLTNTKLYSIDKESYRLVYISDALQDVIPEATLRKPCYEVLYGLKEPCENCPLIARNRRVAALGGTKYETSVAIKHNDDDTVSLMLTEHNEKAVSRDRYDPSLLINTYSSFIDRIDNAFIDGTKGYILLLTLDNIKEIIEVYGNEGYSSLIKDFSKKVSSKLKHINNIYLYRDNVLAVVLPEANRHTVIDDVENLFKISKETMIDDMNVQLNISYITNKYPEAFKNVTDVIKSIDKKLTKFVDPKRSDYLYFTETGYSRQASKEAFILDVIDASFVKDTFGVRLQPEINTKHRIYGAETLIRLTDTYRDIVLPTGEVIMVGERHNKINIITDALINTIGNLYRDNGYQTFKSHGLENISINTNVDYLRDGNLLEKLGSLAKAYMIPRDFLALEFSEVDVYNNKEEFAMLAKKIRGCDVQIIVDHYTGNKLSVEELKKYDVSQVKFEYSLIKSITLYKSDLDRVSLLSRAASDALIKPVLIGIEAPLQYELVKDNCGDFLIQGELLCGPLEPEDFIKTLNKMNK